MSPVRSTAEYRDQHSLVRLHHEFHEACETAALPILHIIVAFVKRESFFP